MNQVIKPLLLAAFLAIFCPDRQAHGQISFSAPGVGSSPVAHCEEYFSYEWNQPLDMSSSENGPLSKVPKNEMRDVNGYSYSNGKLSFQSTGLSPLLVLLEPLPIDSTLGINAALPVGSRYGESHPIDTSKYRYFVVRMKSSADVFGQLIWGMNNSREAITSFSVSKGWKTYEIDMNSVTIDSSTGSNLSWTAANWQQLSFIPVNQSGIDVEIDYIGLVSNTSCGSTNITGTATGASHYGVVVDTNTDPTDGYEAISTNTASGAFSVSVGASGSVPLRKLAPGAHSVYGFVSSDWSTMMTLDPWDMSESTDINSGLTSGFSGITFSGGEFRATTSSTFPSLWLNRTGKTIDAATFKYFTIKADFTLGVASITAPIRVVFLDANTDAIKGEVEVTTTINNGSAIYTKDLSSSPNWNGTIGKLRIDLGNTSGYPVKVDFVALSATSSPISSLSTPSYVSAAGSLNVFNPSLAFYQPDERGGRDFAQTVLGNPWNMNSLDDIAQTSALQSAEILPFNTIIDENSGSSTGDFFRAYNFGNGNGDPTYPVLLGAGVGSRIDTGTFVNLCFRGWNDTESNGYNSVARIIWRSSATNDLSSGYKDGDDIIMNRGVNTYCVDLSSEIGSRVDPPEPGSPNPWTSIDTNGFEVDTLRVDMNEDPVNNFYSVIDFIELRTDHEAHTKFAISIDADLSTEVKLYSKPATGGSETLIGTMNSGRNTNVFEWDTSAVSEGKYRIIAKIIENGNTFAVTAPGRIDINHSRAQDTTAPIITCDRPSASVMFDSTLEVAGYALDETRLAALDVFVDGNYFEGITRNRFDSAARDLYPNHAESNFAGFQSLLEASSISYGAHTIVVKATDTAGNSSSCTVSATRQAGATPAPFEYPSANGTAIVYPVVTPTPTPKVGLKASLVKSSGIKFTVTGGSACSSVNVQGGTTEDLGGAITFFSKPGANSIVANVTGVPTFKKGKKSKEDGIIHVRANCVGGGSSKKIKLDLKRTKNRKTESTEKKLLGYIKKKIKVAK